MRQRASGRKRWAAGGCGRAALLALGVLTGLALTASAAWAAGTSGDLKQKCATDILKQPQILKNEMNLPGKRSQSININLAFQEVDPACDGHFARLASVLPQLVRHGHVINENPIWMPLLQGRGFNYATQAGLLDFNSLNQPDRYWKPGDKVRFMLRLAERNVLIKKIVKTSITVFPVKVRHASASDSTATKTTGTKQQCFSELLQPPRVTKAEMIKPGRTLEVFVKAAYTGVEGCDPWERLGKYKVQIKQAGHWADLEGNFWYPVDFDADPKNTAHEIAFLAFATHGIYEECVKGHWQPARVQFQNSVRNAGTGKIAAKGKIKNHPIKIEPTTAC